MSAVFCFNTGADPFTGADHFPFNCFTVRLLIIKDDQSHFLKEDFVTSLFLVASMMQGDILILKIDGNSTIKEIQENLQKQFPFLKFEFCKDMGSDTKKDKFELLPPSFKVSAFMPVKGNITLTLDGNKRIFELKNDFKNIGLCVVISRRSGNAWVKTSLTEDWSLQTQNSAGENFSN